MTSEDPGRAEPTWRRQNHENRKSRGRALIRSHPELLCLWNSCYMRYWPFLLFKAIEPGFVVTPGKKHLINAFLCLEKKTPQSLECQETVYGH